MNIIADTKYHSIILSPVFSLFHLCFSLPAMATLCLPRQNFATHFFTTSDSPLLAVLRLTSLLIHIFSYSPY